MLRSRQIATFEIAMNPTLWTLSNGLQVVVNSISSMPLAGIALLVRGGARAEYANENGIAHFFEHMLFRGGARYPNEALLARAMEERGGAFNAFTSHEEIICTVHILPEHLDQALDIVSDQVLLPLFSEGDIELERGAVIQEIAGNDDNYHKQLYTIHDRLTFGDHPLGRDILGTKKDILRYQRTNFVSFHKRIFYPRNMILSITGDVDNHAIFDLVQKYFGACLSDDPSNHLFFASVVPQLPQEQIVLADRSSEQTRCILNRTPVSWLSLKQEHRKDRIALSMLAIILGLGMSSRLFQKVRSELGLVYTIETQAQFYSDQGYFLIYFGSNVVNVARVVDVVFRELDHLLADGVCAEEVQKAKCQIKRIYAEQMESSLSFALNQALGVVYQGEQLMNPNDYFEKYIMSVTQEDIMSVARRIFEEKHLRFVAVGPIGTHAKDIEKALIG